MAAPRRQIEANEVKLRQGNCETEGKIMTVLQATRSKTSSDTTRSGRLFVLELSGDRIHSMNPDGSDRKTIVTDGRFPDGIAVDVEAGHIYWTNMGTPLVTTARSSALISTGEIARSSFHKASCPPYRGAFVSDPGSD